MMKQQTQIQSDELPGGWEGIALKELVDFVKGKKPKEFVLENTSGAKPYILISSFEKKRQEYYTNDKFCKECNEDDVLLVWDGARSGLSSFGHRGYIGSTIVALKQKGKKVLPKYLNYFIKNHYHSFNQEVRGTGIPHLEKSYVSNLKIPIPFPSSSEKSLKIQQQIVDKLDAFFEHYNRLKEQKQTAKDNYGKILQGAINRFLIKKDYEKKKLGDICIINPPKSEIKNLNEDRDISFVPMSNVDEIEGNVKILETRKLKDVKKGYTYFKENDVLFAKITPCMENGKVVITKCLKNKIGFGSTEFHVIRPNENISSDYLFYFMRQPSFRQEAKMNMTGTAGQLRVPSNFLKNYEIPLPSIEEQKEIVNSLNKIKENYKVLLQQQSLIDKKIEQLPKAVLRKAFKGEL